MPFKLPLSNIIFLPAVLLLGCFTSWEDFKTSRIRNQWIKRALIYAVSAYFLIGIFSLPFFKKMTQTLGVDLSVLLWHFDRWCVNLTVSCVAAYLLWYHKMWGAGDAKLFICYSALIPMSQYSKIYLNYYFASFFLLMAIFIPATIYLLLRALVYFIKRFEPSGAGQKISGLFKETATRILQIKTWQIIVGFFVFFLFFGMLRERLSQVLGRLLPDRNLLILVSLLLYKKLSVFFKRKNKYFFLLLLFLVPYVYFTSSEPMAEFVVRLKGILLNIFSIMILFPIFNKLLDLYTERTVKKTTSFAGWMFIGVLILWFI